MAVVPKPEVSAPPKADSPRVKFPVKLLVETFVVPEIARIAPPLEKAPRVEFPVNWLAVTVTIPRLEKMAPPPAYSPEVEFPVNWQPVRATAPVAVKIAPPNDPVPVVEFPESVEFRTVNVVPVADPNRMAPPSSKLPVVLPFFSVIPVTAKSPAVTSKIRDAICESMIVLAGPFPMRVTVSEIVIWPCSRSISCPAIATEKEIRSAPGVAFAARIASRREVTPSLPLIMSAAVVTSNNAGTTRSSNDSTHRGKPKLPADGVSPDEAESLNLANRNGTTTSTPW
jgi:hypothetical protein